MKEEIELFGLSSILKREIFYNILDRIGQMPLPPYITKRLENKERYQTVYSKELGSAAAPTAGLHFTPELLEKLKNKGIRLGFVTLHVGLGTFRPVKVDDVTEHKMHSEHYEISQEVADLIFGNKEKRRQSDRSRNYQLSYRGICSNF